ncbi:hypothetical protein [Pedobacter sp.]|uniref:hypothetical protein n=1 Tax=Pedobacter sp. TaxID=1411316 RepID=UPI003BAD734E
MRNSALDLLNGFVGNWKTEGTLPNGTIIQGSDAYEWLDGNFFLLHHVNVRIGDRISKSIEIFHYDELEDVFRAQSFDNEGNISISAMKIEHNKINIEADGLRFKGKFKDNEIVGVWEQYENNCWKKWMDISLSKL